MFTVTLFNKFCRFLRKTRIYRSDCIYIGPLGGKFYVKANWQDGKIPNLFSNIITDATYPEFPAGKYFFSLYIKGTLDCSIAFPEDHSNALNVTIGGI